MKRTVFCILLVFALVFGHMLASAEIDFSGMSLDELLAVQEQLEAAIEKVKQEADEEDSLEAEDEPAGEPAEADDQFAELDESEYIHMEKGAKGDEVKALQTRLFDLGFYSIAIDGDYGNGTVKAIQAFEEYNGLEQTGIATPKLQAILFSDQAKAKPVEVSSIKFSSGDSKSPIVLVGGTLDLNTVATVLPENATEKGLAFEIDGEEFAELDDNGVLSGKARGEVTITATSLEKVDNPKSATVKVKVYQPTKTLQLSDTNLDMGKGSTSQLEAVVGPEDADDRTVTWNSENPEVATVSSKGLVTAKGCGECDIICTTNDGSGLSSKCHVVVTQLVTSVKLPDSKITLPSGQSYEAVATVLPEDATNKELVWASSDDSVAKVSEDGKITATKKGGDCEITCTASDGSEKQATVKVHVPTFSVSETEYTVTSKSGTSISVDINGDHTVEASSSAGCFDIEWDGKKLWIDPIKAGSGTVKLSNPEAKEDTVTLKITIDHDAVYDSTSYPKATYDKILRDPYEYKGDKMSIYGKVLQKSEGWGSVVLRVGTGGYGYYDKVFWVEYSTSSVSAKVIEDDYITVYGTCDGAHTYETVMGASVTIPAIDAEKIIIGRK